MSAPGLTGFGSSDGSYSSIFSQLRAEEAELVLRQLIDSSWVHTEVKAAEAEIGAGPSPSELAAVIQHFGEAYYRLSNNSSAEKEKAPSFASPVSSFSTAVILHPKAVLTAQQKESLKVQKAVLPDEQRAVVPYSLPAVLRS